MSFNNKKNQKIEEKTVSICWRHLTVKANGSFQVPYVNKSLTKKSILQSINGYFTASSLNGLLGPSGAGKTTLLNVLSGSTVNFSGSLQYKLSNNHQEFLKKSNKLSPVSYYLHQQIDDSVVFELTIEQLLNYSYCFKNDVTRSGQNCKAKEHIETILSALSLSTDLLNQKLSKCSGGERKRVTIAQELMSLVPPTFFFIDEPTTGLDSVSAFEVMACLKGLTVRHPQMTIVTSIHAPNDETLSLFDKLYVLAKGGVPVYEGPPGGIRMTFETVTCAKILSDEPPIEALLKVACSGLSNLNVINLAKHQNEKFFESEKLKPQVFTYSESQHSTFQTLKSHKTFCFSNFATHISRQLRITFLAQLPYFLFLPFFLVGFYALFCTIVDLDMTTANDCYPIESSYQNSNITSTQFTNGTTCNNEEKLKEEGLFKQNTHYLSYVAFMVFFICTLVSTLLYSKTLNVFTAEHKNRWYSLGVFFGSSSLVSLLEITLTITLVASFSYLISGQQAIDHVLVNDPSSFNWTRLALFVFFVLHIAVYSQAIGHLMGALCANWPTRVALLSCDLVATSLCLYNGLYIKLERMRGPDDLMVTFEKFIGFAGLSRGLFYSIYGFEKCDLLSDGQHYSWVLEEYNVRRELLLEYVWRALINVVLIKVVTLGVLWWQFSSWSWSSQRKLKNRTKKENIFYQDLSCNKPVEELKMNFKNNGKENRNSLTLLNSKDEQKSLVHSKSCILLAWHNLGLLQNGSFLFANQKQLLESPLILNNLNGAIRFNSLTALMGTSGAGKTSLLRVLNGQCKARLTTETKFYLSTLTPIKTCFIAQDVSGHFLRGLTAFQTLRYASMLRNTVDLNKTEIKPEVSKSFDHHSIALRWLSELGLEDAAQTRVETLSGGEAKRLAVAIEMVSTSMPHLLCIDEPTSGLDSSSAETVVRALKNLTNSHPLLTILTSVHQPTAEVLALFDTLYVLAKGGVAIYAEHPGKIQKVFDATVNSAQKQSSFKETKFSPFPIENLIRQSCLGAENPTNLELATLIRAQFFESSAFKVEIAKQTALFSNGVPTNRTRFNATSIKTLSTRYLACIKGYLWKEWLFFVLCSTGFVASLRLFYSPTIATYSGCLNLVEEDTSACAVKSISKLQEEFALKDNLTYGYFFTTFYQVMVVLFTSRPFISDFQLFESEHRNGAYSAGVWYLVQSMAGVTLILPSIFAFVAIVDIYEPVLEFFFYPHLVLLTFLGVLATTAQGHALSILSCKSMPLQTVLIIGYTFFSLLIGNFVVPVEDMHYFWRGLANFSAPRYLFEALIALQYGYGRCPNKGEVSSILYGMSINKEDAQSVYGHSLRMLAFNAILFRLLALWLFVRQANPTQNRKCRVDRIEAYRKETLEIENWTQKV